MPARDRAVEFMMVERYGPQRFDGRIGECISMPDYDERSAEMNLEFGRLIEHIDWQRVLLEAAQRHQQLDHDDDVDVQGLVTGICAECIQEALLLEERFPTWAK